MDTDFEKIFSEESSADPFGARAEIIPIVNKDDESFLLHEESIPEEMAMLPLRDNVLFPGVVMPLVIGRKASLRLVKAAERSEERIVCVSQKNDSDEPEYDDIYKYGVIGRVLRVIELPQNETMAVIQGTMKCYVKRITAREPYLRCKAELFNESLELEHPKLFHSRVLEIRRLYAQLQEEKTNGQGPKQKDILNSLRNIRSERISVNYIAVHLDLITSEKQMILEANSYEKRADMVLDFINKELDYVHLRDQVQNKARHEMDRQQREYFLNQQMRVIQDELGGSPVDIDIQRLEDRADKKHWPLEAKRAFNKTLEKLRRTPSNTPDYNIELSYAELLLDLPWDYCSKDDTRINHAKKVLDKEHYGLEKIKERIIEYIAVLHIKGNLKSPILCLVGPPGTGKTSLCKSIAQALNRQYVRVALGGLHDESEIRGHRKTYIGAMPGRIISNIKKANTSNPVFVLDEIDKVQGMSHNGDPSAALLEVLDPEQNNAFHDNYLDIDYDLSKVMFIATANNASTIPAPLLDRMEIIDLSGYILEEKVEIANRHLVPRQMEAHGFDKKAFKFEKKAIVSIINDYTRESGVRQLEKAIGKIVRQHAVMYVNLDSKWRLPVSADKLKGFLGLPIHNSDMRGSAPRVGVVTGLAWTQVGGEILFIEASLSKGKGTLTMTGNLGDVMKESATLAFEYLKANAEAFGIDNDKIDNSNIHIHVPEGATPKDGPSAGITMFVAMVSVFTQTNVKPTVAMTGEITLRGAVTPIGGVKEKILAAKRANITDIILCEDNRRDIEDIPQTYLKGLTFHYIHEMKEALPIAFEK